MIWRVLGYGSGIVMATIPVSYFFFSLSNRPFLESTMANWFATIAGVVIGIPIALAINRHSVAVQEERSAAEQRKVARERQFRILTLLKQELEFDLKYLENINASASRSGVPSRGVHVGSLRDIFWSTFSNGQDARWLVDAQLIESVSLAYYYLRNTIFLERQFFAAFHFPTIPQQEKVITQYLQAHDFVTITAVKAALENIETQLRSLTHRRG